MGADPRQEAARKVLAWIARKRCTSFTKRDCHRDLVRTFKDPNDLDAPLGMLVDRGYLRRQPEPQTTGRGRRPSPGFDVNPKWDATTFGVPAYVDRIDYVDRNTPNPNGIAHSVDSVNTPEWEEVVI